jgi:AraC-like DNA-binding protein
MFSGKIRSMPDVRFESFGLNARLLAPPKPMGRIHHHHEVELNLMFRGAVTYLHRGSVRRLEPGRLTVFWGSTPHSLIAVEPGSVMAWITVPLAWVWSWSLPERFMRGLMEGSWWIAPAGAGDRYPVRAWVQELAKADAKSRRRLLLELQACFLWLAEQTTAKSPAPPPQTTGGLQHVERMARCMAERFREELTVRDVAAAAALHPNYAMPLFRQHCGVTIRDYLLQHRLTRAQQLLLMTDDKVIDVALASGFGSLSAFYEAFTRVGKETPQKFRRRMRA